MDDPVESGIGWGKGVDFDNVVFFSLLAGAAGVGLACEEGTEVDCSGERDGDFGLLGGVEAGARVAPLGLGLGLRPGFDLRSVYAFFCFPAELVGAGEGTGSGFGVGGGGGAGSGDGTATCFFSALTRAAFLCFFPPSP